MASKVPYTTSKKTDAGDDSTVDAESQNSESLHCGVCTTGVDYIVQCEKCDTWYCHTCAKVSEQLIELIADCNGVHWFCHKCNDIVVKAISNFGKSNDDGPAKGDGGITKQLSEVQTQIQKLVDHVNIQLDTRLKEFESKMDHKFGKAPPIQDQQDITNSNPRTSGDSNWINDNITTRVIDEYRDRENCKLNLILYSVPEIQTGDVPARKVYDTNYVSDIANKIQAEKVDITSVSRLGKKVDNKNRLLKVQVANLSQKRSLLLNVQKLKQCSGDLQNIYVTPDLSYNERQANRLLRHELSRQKEAGETDLVIYRGNIMKKQMQKSNVSASHHMDTTQPEQHDTQPG